MKFSNISRIDKHNASIMFIKSKISYKTLLTLIEDVRL
jgi:hypothetical protein